MNTSEIVEHDVERDRPSMVLEVLAVSICQPRETPHMHSDRKVAALDVGRADVLRIGVPSYPFFLSPDALGGAVAPLERLGSLAAQLQTEQYPLVLDLDPDPKIEWKFVVETALKLRDLLEEEGLPTWPKLTGGKGVHVVVPVEPTLSWEEGRAYIRAIAERLAATTPTRYTLASSLALRPGRIYLDYARNGLGATAVGCYSPRARPGFPVALPVTWEDLERGVRSSAFTLARAGAPAVREPIRRQRWTRSLEA